MWQPQRCAGFERWNPKWNPGLPWTTPAKEPVLHSPLISLVLTHSSKSSSCPTTTTCAPPQTSIIVLPTLLRQCSPRSYISAPALLCRCFLQSYTGAPCTPMSVLPQSYINAPALLRLHPCTPMSVLPYSYVRARTLLHQCSHSPLIWASPYDFCSVLVLPVLLFTEISLPANQVTNQPTDSIYNSNALF